MKITGKEKTKEKESRSRRKADYLSVYDLFLRSGGCKVGIVIALTLLVEAITLVVLMQGETMYYENLFARGAALPFGIGFLLLTLALIDPLRAQKSNVDYTIRAAYPAVGCLLGGDGLCTAGIFRILGAERHAAVRVRRVFYKSYLDGS